MVEERLLKSHLRAQHAAKYEGKAIIAPSSRINTSLIPFVATLAAIPIAVLLAIAFDLGFTRFLAAYMLSVVACLLFGFYLKSCFFVVDESLEESLGEILTGSRQTIRQTYFKNK